MPPAPSWPTGEMLPDGTPLSEVVRLFAVAILRGVVFWSARFGVFGLLLAPLGGWLRRGHARLRGGRARDVWRLAALALPSCCRRSLRGVRPAQRRPAFCSASPATPRLAARPAALGPVRRLRSTLDQHL